MDDLEVHFPPENCIPFIDTLTTAVKPPPFQILLEEPVAKPQPPVVQLKSHTEFLLPAPEIETSSKLTKVISAVAHASLQDAPTLIRRLCVLVFPVAMPLWFLAKFAMLLLLSLTLPLILLWEAYLKNLWRDSNVRTN